jgi:TRAP-type C4-dicarboxylate transport system substrate-binding protein
MKNTPSSRRVAVAAGVMLTCVGGAPVAGAGVESGSETVVLQLATIDQVNGNGQAYGPEAFVNNLESISDGQLHVEVLVDYGAGDAEAESQIVEDIATGEIDGGWPTVRAFANAGIPGLEAVEAPMTITSYDAERELVSGPIAETVLSRLEGTGIVGLNLAVGPLRRPFAGGEPLLGPEDWQGARFRAYNSPVQADAVTALGGEPVNIGFGWLDEVAAGNLRGAEFDIAQYYINGLSTEAGLVTSNVVLWPKVYVLSLSQQTFDALTDEQRGWVTQAAEQASQTSVEATYDETTLARELCESGTRFIPASPEQIDALRAAVAPVIDGLAADPNNVDLLAGIQALAADYPDPDIPDVPDDCQQPATAATPASTPVETAAGTADSAAGDATTFPEGVYLAESPNGDILTMTYGDGVWRGFLEDGTMDCVSTYTVENGRIWLTSSSDVRWACGNPPGLLFLDAAWTFEGDQLRLTDINSDPGAVRAFGLPWTRVADDSDAVNDPDGFPEGVYRVVAPDGTVVTDVLMDGVWSGGFIDGGRLDCSFTYELESGRISVTTSSCPGTPPNFMLFDATWTFDGNQLQFTDIHSDPDTVRDFGRPRTRIAVGADAQSESGGSTSVP